MTGIRPVNAPRPYRRVARSTQKHPGELARAGWALFGWLSTFMAILCALAVSAGPEANQPVFMLLTVIWVLCAFVSARGFKEA